MTVETVTGLAVGVAFGMGLFLGGFYRYDRRRAEVGRRAYRAFTVVYLPGAVLPVLGAFFAVELSFL